MSTRRIISSLIGAAVTIAALWAYAYRAPVAPQVAPIAPNAAPTASKPVPITPIVDGATIDFSSGKASVGTTDADKAALDAAVKQIDEANKSVTFPAETPAKK